MTSARSSRRTTLRALVFGAALAVALGVVPSSFAQSSDEAASRSLVSSARTSAGRAAMSSSPGLDSVARAHAARMAASNTIFHNENKKAEADAAGVRWTILGENVGVGPDVRAVHDGFMASPSHHSNVVHPGYDALGVGVAVGSEGSVFVVHLFAQVQASAPPPPAAEPASHPAPVDPAPSAPSVLAGPSATPALGLPALSEPAAQAVTPDPNAVIGGVVAG